MVETRGAVDGEELVAGDVVRTGADAALAELCHTAGAVTRLDSETEVAVDRQWAKGRPRVVVTLGPGRTWHRIGPLEDGALFEVRCPGAVLTARLASFALVCADDGVASLTVVSGNVLVRGLAGRSTVLGGGQRAVVGADGVVAGVSGLAGGAGDPWIALNTSLDAGPLAVSTSPADVEIAPEGLPRWVGRMGMVLAGVAFVGVLALTFVTAKHSRPAAAPSGAAAAMLEASESTGSPSETTTTVATAPAPVEPAPLPPAASAEVKPVSCRQSGRTVVYRGTLTNVSTVSGSFAVDTVFVGRDGRPFASGSAAAAGVGPGQTVRWEVRAPAGGDLRNSGASCETAGLRVLPELGDQRVDDVDHGPAVRHH